MGRKKDNQRTIPLTVHTARRTVVNVRKTVDARLAEISKSRLWLSGKMGVRPATVYDYLNGRAKIQSDKVERMLAVLGLEIRAKE